MQQRPLKKILCNDMHDCKMSLIVVHNFIFYFYWDNAWMSISCSTIAIEFLTNTFSLFLQFLFPSQNTVTKQNFFIIEQLCGHEVLIKILHFLIVFYVYPNVEFLQNLYIHTLVNYLPNLIYFNNYRDRVSHSLNCLASWYFQCYEIS